MGAFQSQTADSITRCYTKDEMMCEMLHQVIFFTEQWLYFAVLQGHIFKEEIFIITLGS